MKKWLFVLLAVVAWWWKRDQDQQNAVSLKNKVVILTGASGGIGKATAHAFAQAGAHLLLVDVNANGLSLIQSELEPYGVKVVTVASDITHDNASTDIVTLALDTFGRIDVLVNNAGLVISGDMTLHRADVIRRVFDVNVFALIRLSQAVVPIMQKQHSGHIVNLASCAATMPSAGYAVYGATKGAVVTFSHALRREVMADGVRVSYIAPGWIATQMIAHMDASDMQRAGMTNRLMSFDIRQPKDVANGILEAVRYNRYEVIVGGLGYHNASLLHRLAPRWLDKLYATSTDRKRLLATAHRPE